MELLQLDFNSWSVILGVAFGLGCDAFSVGLALGTRGLNRRAAFRLYFHFGLFQFLMPIIGWHVGRSLLKQIQAIDHWIAFGVVGAIGVKMLIESFKAPDPEGLGSHDLTRGFSLVGLSVATSLDALGVGFSMGILGASVYQPALYIGLVAGCMTFVGIRLGGGLSGRFGKRVESVGALILLFIALNLLQI